MPDLNPNSTATDNPFVPVQTVTATALDGIPAAAEPLYPPQGPDPAGTKSSELDAMAHNANASPSLGPGTEGEEVVWESAYSMRNFLGRIAFRVILTIAWLAMAIETWGTRTYNNLAPMTIALGVVLLVFWMLLLYRMAQARYGHYYRLTNRRLFVSTGLMRRRRDQMELLRVKDVYTRQTLLERSMSLGSVIVVSSENEAPMFYITGVDDPKQVMDLIWNAARTERDNRSTNIHSV